jgi:hypothetical protein
METAIEKYDEPNPNKDLMSVFRHAMYQPSEEKVKNRIRFTSVQDNFISTPIEEIFHFVFSMEMVKS